MSEPRVFKVGDPEPPQDVTKLKADDGSLLVRLSAGWWWLETADGRDSWHPPADGMGWSWPPVDDDFPLTEVVSS